MNFQNFELPVGMRDLLPVEAGFRRCLQNNLVEIFQKWAYEEVMTPTLEHYETFSQDTGVEILAQTYKLIDDEGNLLTLRPDMTMPIARLAAGRFRNYPLPLRFFYFSHVFRYENPQAGRQREFTQAGIELMGTTSPRADAEVLALAVESLNKVGLTDFQLVLGHNAVFNGIMENTGVQEEDKQEIKLRISRKDFVGLEELLEKLKLPTAERELILKLPELYGGKEVLERATKLDLNPTARGGLENLGQVFEAFESFNLKGKVCLDLGMLRDFDYYTGIVFEGYVSGLGFPVCGGGRYDRLVGKFGFDCPATGFALGLERVLLALKGDLNFRPKAAADYLVAGTELRRILKKAVELREQNYKVEVEATGRNKKEAAAYAVQKGIKNMVYFGREEGDGEN